jgi:[Skp1-protein]-hydroxyproline N-acetylglucosaminyltransferase
MLRQSQIEILPEIQEESNEVESNIESDYDPTSVPSKDSIFVSLASYRDPECNNTLYDLFTKAKYPERVFVGVCQQNAPEDNDCMSERLLPYSSQIRILRLSHFDAQGPMLARALIEQNLYQHELFYMQIDSHMLFVQDWDEVCIAQLALCPSEKPILTTYPNDFDRLTRKHAVLPDGTRHPLGTIPPTFIRFREFHKRLKFTEQEKNNFAAIPGVPYPSLFWAAGFSFSLGELIQQVPYDYQCPFLFLGEEMGIAIRYFTHGWDFFAPGVNIVYHLLKRTYRNTFWEQVYKKNCVVDDDTRLSRKALEEQAVQRTTDLIYGRLPENDMFGLGKERTIKDWEMYTGVDIRSQTASQRSYLGLSPHATLEEKQAKHGKSFSPNVPVPLVNHKQHFQKTIQPPVQQKSQSSQKILRSNRFNLPVLDQNKTIAIKPPSQRPPPVFFPSKIY